MWKQLHFEFTWPELTQKEIEEVLSHFSIKLGYFVVVDLVEGSFYYANADLFRCKKAILEAQTFYTRCPGYLGMSYLNRYYLRRHFQLLFKT